MIPTGLDYDQLSEVKEAFKLALVIEMFKDMDLPLDCFPDNCKSMDDYCHETIIYEFAENFLGAYFDVPDEACDDFDEDINTYMTIPYANGIDIDVIGDALYQSGVHFCSGEEKDEEITLIWHGECGDAYNLFDFLSFVAWVLKLQPECKEVL